MANTSYDASHASRVGGPKSSTCWKAPALSMVSPTNMTFLKVRVPWGPKMEKSA